MSNLHNPVDDALLDLAAALNDMLSLFMRDNELCEREREVYTTVKRAHAVVSRDRDIERAFHYYQNNPTNPSDYGLDLMEKANVAPINLESRRKARTVIPFPRSNNG